MKITEQYHYRIADMTAALLIISIIIQIMSAVLFVLYMNNEVRPYLGACLSSTTQISKSLETQTPDSWETLLEEGLSE